MDGEMDKRANQDLVFEKGVDDGVRSFDEIV